MSLNITVLLENKNRHPQLDGGVGLSLLLDDGEQRILFDTGQDQRFCDNAHRLGIDLGTLTRVVLSHGHYDHFGGLPYLIPHTPHKPEVICHPDVFLTRYAGKFVGSRAIRLKKSPQKIAKQRLKRIFLFAFLAIPYRLAVDLFLLVKLSAAINTKVLALLKTKMASPPTTLRMIAVSFGREAKASSLSLAALTQASAISSVMPSILQASIKSAPLLAVCIYAVQAFAKCSTPAAIFKHKISISSMVVTAREPGGVYGCPTRSR